MKNDTATTRRRSDTTPVRAHDSAEHSAVQRGAADPGSVALTRGTAARQWMQAPGCTLGRASVSGESPASGLRKSALHVTPPHERGKQQAKGDAKRSETPNRLLALLQKGDIIAFQQPSGEPWVSLPRPGGGYEHHRAENSRVVGWLMEQYTHTYREVPDKRQAENAVMTFAAKVRACDDIRPVYDRLAVVEAPDGATNGATHGATGGRTLYLDLGDALHVVRMTAGEWEVIDAPSRVAFRRPTGYETLPVPVRLQGELLPGALLERDLRPLLNCPAGPEGDFNYQRMVAWLIAAFYTEGDQALLVLTGEPGSGKSSVAETLRALIDPNSTRHGNPVTTAEGVMFEAVRQYVPCFDNLRHLSDAVSDALANVATGSGQAKRKLYTDDDIISVFAKRPVILNGIHTMVKRPDLVDRALVLTLPTLDERNRQFTKAQLRRTFEERQPRLLGAVLEVVATALARLPAVLAAHAATGAGHYRLGDFHMFVRAAEPALGWTSGTADRIMRQQQQEKRQASMTQYADIEALVTLLYADLQVAKQYGVKETDSGRVRMLRGAVGEVLTDLGAYARERLGYDLKDSFVGWPKLPKKFAQHLREAETALASEGVGLRFETSHHRTIVTVRGTCADTPDGAPTDAASEGGPAEDPREESAKQYEEVAADEPVGSQAGSQAGSQGSQRTSPSPVSGPMNSGLGSQGSQGSQQFDLLQGKEKRGEREQREETQNVPSPPSPPSPDPLNSASEAGSQRGGKTGCLPGTPDQDQQDQAGGADVQAALDALRAKARQYAQRSEQSEQMQQTEQSDEKEEASNGQQPR